MCDCKNKNTDGKPIGVLLDENKYALANVFKRYGWNDVPVTLDTVFAGTVQFGNTFTREAAAAMHANSSLSGDQQIGITESVLTTLGQLATAGVSVAALVKGQQQSGAPTAGQILQSPAPAPSYPAPQQPAKQETKILGLTVGQFAIAAGVVVLVVVTLGFFGFKAMQNAK
jgi:hypothetical protein